MSFPSGCRHAGTGRDWAALPRDIVLDIFLRLGPREVMLGAEFACRPWRRVALEEPSLWRCVCMENPANDKHWRCRHPGVEMAMKLVAVDRAALQCQAFQGDCGDDYLLNLVARAPSLKCLRIEHYNHYRSGEKLLEALMKLTLLEELEIHFQYNLVIEWNDIMLQSVCQACSHLKKLVLMYASTFYLVARNKAEYSKETIGREIPVMPKLHTLKLSDCVLSGEGLKAVLDSCPVLETLHIDGYFDKCEMDKELRMKCAMVKNLTLPTRIPGNVNLAEEFYYFDSDSEDDDSLEEY